MTVERSESVSSRWWDSGSSDWRKTKLLSMAAASSTHASSASLGMATSTSFSPSPRPPLPGKEKPLYLRKTTPASSSPSFSEPVSPSSYKLSQNLIRASQRAASHKRAGPCRSILKGSRPLSTPSRRPDEITHALRPATAGIVFRQPHPPNAITSQSASVSSSSVSTQYQHHHQPHHDQVKFSVLKLYKDASRMPDIAPQHQQQEVHRGARVDPAELEFEESAGSKRVHAGAHPRIMMLIMMLANASCIRKKC
eukprot:713692-Rhodomonas_salina.1